jgi:multimeric flavodoxin WrbA
MIGIVGSPRRGGNTELLVDEVLTGAQETGAHTRKYILNELYIAPCQGCGGCHKTHECVQEDDMKKLLEDMNTCTTWVLGTPIYW